MNFSFNRKGIGNGIGINKNKIISVIVTFFVISLLIYAGPASAINVSLSGFTISNNDNGEDGEDIAVPEDGIEKGQLTTTTAVVEIHSNERLVLENGVLYVNGFNKCVFDAYSGEKISGCNGIKISVLENANSGYGYGYGYKYGYQNGYGYEYGYHQGFNNGNFKYEIEINSSYLSSGNNNIQVEIDVGEKSYKSNNQVVKVNLKQEQQHATQEVVEVSETTDEIVIDTGSSSVQDIKINSSISASKEIKINMASLLDNEKVTVNNELSLIRETTSSYNYSAVIPAGTKISGVGWDGTITLPTLKTASDFSMNNGNVEVAIDLGSGVELTFDKPVQVIIGGQAGKKAGWARGTSALTNIETICDSATNPTNIDSVNTKECYIDSGNDLLIWTYHFTTFASYTGTSAVTVTGGSGSSRGSSGCKTNWICSEWSVCENGLQTRKCEKEKDYCAVFEEKPIEQRQCEITQETSTGFFARIFGITGAVIGALGSNGILAMVFILVIIVGVIVVVITRRDELFKRGKKGKKGK